MATTISDQALIKDLMKGDAYAFDKIFHRYNEKVYAFTLSNGHWVLAYNDLEDGRYSLAVSISEDEGKTWKYTRHIELDQADKNIDQRIKSSYPSIIQGKDGMIHVIYSYHMYYKIPDPETIKYVRFAERWIKEEGKYE
ncbi:MAG: exo-alpha-sialidase [Bacteroidota bacterium]